MKPTTAGEPAVTETETGELSQIMTETTAPMEIAAFLQVSSTALIACSDFLQPVLRKVANDSQLFWIMS